MKHRYFVTLFAFPILLLILCFSCGKGYRVETVLTGEGIDSMSDSDKSLTVQALKSRLNSGGYGEVEVTDSPEGISVITDLADTSALTLQDLEVYFGSVSVGLYDAASVADPKLQNWINGLSPNVAAFFPGQWTYGNSNTLLEVPYGQNYKVLLDSLKVSLPTGEEYALLWSRRKPQAPNVKEVGRSLYLYRNSRDTGGPRIDNTGIESAETIDTEYGDRAIVVKFTEGGRKIFTAMTTEAFHDNNRHIGIVVNGEVWSNPSVQGVIMGGETWITGNMENDPLAQIARQLAWEPLPVKLKIISQRVLPNK